MKSNAEAVLAKIVNTEGGYAERATEGGGAVNHGVTFTVFQAWRGLKGQSSTTWADLKLMTRAEAIEIFTEQFLKPVSFDDLPIGVDYCMADAAVNGGPTGSIKILQEALGFPDEKCDGHFGLVTRWAVTHRVVPDLINRLCDERLETYRTFKNWTVVAVEETGRTWGEIWTTRIAKVRETALGMAGSPPPVAVMPAVAVSPRLSPILPSPYINRLGMELILEGWTPEGFGQYVERSVGPKMAAWRPRGIVLHATYQPSLQTWDDDKTVRKISEPQRIANMVPLWQKNGFKASPHLFIDREEIWTATPLWKRGTHTPSWNGTHWGIEMVGNYADEPGEPLPDSLRDLTVFACASLFLMLGYEPGPDTLRFHGEDPKTTHHRCPGKNVPPKPWWDKAIENKMAELAPGEHYAKD